MSKNQLVLATYASCFFMLLLDGGNFKIPRFASPQHQHFNFYRLPHPTLDTYKKKFSGEVCTPVPFSDALGASPLLPGRKKREP